MKKDEYIKELERQVKYYNDQLDHIKNIFNMISTLIISNQSKNDYINRNLTQNINKVD